MGFQLILLWFDAILAATTKVVMPVTADLYMTAGGMQDVFDKVELLKMRKVTSELKVSVLYSQYYVFSY